jgi:hypothetical protein
VPAPGPWIPPWIALLRAIGLKGVARWIILISSDLFSWEA